METPIRIDLLAGSILYGTVLTKSAAGITLRAADGTIYKFGRKELSAQTIANLALPPEERSTANHISTTTETPDPVAIKQKNEELERKVAELRQENAALRQQAPVPVWQEITGGGYTGWVNAQYLVAETPAPGEKLN